MLFLARFRYDLNGFLTFLRFSRAPKLQEKSAVFGGQNAGFEGTPKLILMVSFCVGVCFLVLFWGGPADRRFPGFSR